MMRFDGSFVFIVQLFVKHYIKTKHNNMGIIFHRGMNNLLPDSTVPSPYKLNWVT